jgi:hypothetical protein
MTSSQERRRQRRCPSCGGGDIFRGPKVEGLTIPVIPVTEGRSHAGANVYCDVCNECGMVTFFVRLSDLKR